METIPSQTHLHPISSEGLDESHLVYALGVFFTSNNIRNSSNVRVGTTPHLLGSKIDLCFRQFRGEAAQGRQTEVARAEHSALLQVCQPPSAKRSPAGHQTATSKKKIAE